MLERGRRAAKYLNLVLKFPLRPIRSDDELGEAIAVIDALTDRDDLDRAEKDYLDVLSDLVEQYESEAHPMPRATDAELLHHLIEAKGVTQAQVAKETGIAETTISLVLSGKRALSRSHIGELARYFHVTPAAFNF